MGAEELGRDPLILATAKYKGKTLYLVPELIEHDCEGCTFWTGLCTRPTSIKKVINRDQSCSSDGAIIVTSLKQYKADAVTLKLTGST